PCPFAVSRLSRERKTASVGVGIPPTRSGRRCPRTNRPWLDLIFAFVVAGGDPFSVGGKLISNRCARKRSDFGVENSPFLADANADATSTRAQRWGSAPRLGKQRSRAELSLVRRKTSERHTYPWAGPNGSRQSAVAGR